MRFENGERKEKGKKSKTSFKSSPFFILNIQSDLAPMFFLSPPIIIFRVNWIQCVTLHATALFLNNGLKSVPSSVGARDVSPSFVLGAHGYVVCNVTWVSFAWKKEQTNNQTKNIDTNTMKCTFLGMPLPHYSSCFPATWRTLMVFNALFSYPFNHHRLIDTSKGIKGRIT